MAPFATRSEPRCKTHKNRPAARRNSRRGLFLERLEDRSLLAQLTFGTPFNLGAGVNTAHVDDVPSVTADGLSLLFATSRFGSVNTREILEVTRLSTDVPFGNAVSAGFEINLNEPANNPDVSQDGPMSRRMD